MRFDSPLQRLHSVLTGILVFCLILPLGWPSGAALAQPPKAKPLQPPVGIQQPVSLAVLELESRGADPVLTAALSDLLRIQLRNHTGLRLLERVRMRDILQEQHFQLSEHCGDSESCLQETGRMLGVQRLVVGAVHQVDNFYSTHLHLLDVHSGQIMGAATLQCTCSIEDMLMRAPQQLVQQLAAALYAEIPTGTLRVDSSPSGADVILNQHLLGQTPLHLPEIAAGEHTLLLRRPNYQVKQQQVQIAPAQQVALSLTLLEEQQGGSLNVQGVPSGAHVAINGEPHGPAPLTRDALPPGLHQVTVSHPDYHAQTHTVMVEAGQAKDFEVQLLPLHKPRGTLRIQSTPSQATVYVNEVYQGHTPLMLMLDAEVHQLSLRRSGYQLWEQDVEVTSERVLVLNPTLNETEHAWVLPSVLLGSVVALLGGAMLFRGVRMQRADTLDISIAGAP